MKRLYTSQQRDEGVQVKRILEEHLLPCLLVTNGDGDWRVYLNIATYAPDYEAKVAQAENILQSYGYEAKEAS